jgi:hypothetical protein
MTDAVTDTDRPTPAPAGSSGAPRAGWRWRALALLAAGQLAAGVLIGVIWRVWAPKTTSYLLSGGAGKAPFVVPDESESQIAGDGRFVLLSVLVGVVFGALAWQLRSRRGPLAVSLLAVTGVLSSLLARAVGELLSHGSSARRVNAAFTPQLSLHAFAALWVQAFFAVLVYTALAGLSSDPELDGSNDQSQPDEQSQPDDHGQLKDPSQPEDQSRPDEQSRPANAAEA